MYNVVGGSEYLILEVFNEKLFNLAVESPKLYARAF